MLKYRYHHESFSKLETNIPDKAKWVEEQLNVIGSRGQRAVGYPIPSAQPSSFTTADGRPLANFMITVLVETPYYEEEELVVTELVAVPF